MNRLGAVLALFGFGSALLHFTGYQFRLLMWADGIQPFFGLGLGALGAVLLLIPMLTNKDEPAQGGYGQPPGAPGGPVPGGPAPQAAFGQQGFPPPGGPAPASPPGGFPQQPGYGPPQGGFPQQPAPAGQPGAFGPPPGGHQPPAPPQGPPPQNFGPQGGYGPQGR